MTAPLEVEAAGGFAVTVRGRCPVPLTWGPRRWPTACRSHSRPATGLPVLHVRTTGGGAGRRRPEGPLGRGRPLVHLHLADRAVGVTRLSAAVDALPGVS